MGVYTTEQINKAYDALTKRMICECEFESEMVGGVPADEKALRAFAQHQMNVPPEEIEKVVRKILDTELQVDVDAPEGELEESIRYGVCKIRRTSFGPYIAGHMVQAMIKAAASRVGLFVKKKGSKGDLAEMGKVTAYGPSLRDVHDDDETIALYKIHVVDKEGHPAPTIWQTFRGRVNNAAGSMSISSSRECVEVGNKFFFSYQFYDGKVTESDAVNIMAAASNIGLGSAKAFARGKFKVVRMEVV